MRVSELLHPLIGILENVAGELVRHQRKIESGYFETLGVNAIWISPINLNPEGLWVGVEGGPPRYEGYHGYWRVSNTEIEPSFGSPAELKNMIESAQERGIRVLRRGFESSA